MACHIHFGDSDVRTRVQEVDPTFGNSSGQVLLWLLLACGPKGGHSSSHVLLESLLPCDQEGGPSSK